MWGTGSFHPALIACHNSSLVSSCGNTHVSYNSYVCSSYSDVLLITCQVLDEGVEDF